MNIGASFLGNPASAWIAAAAAFLLVLVAFRLFRRVVLKRLDALSRRTETYLDDLVAAVLARTSRLFLAIVAAYAGARFLSLPPEASRIIARVVVLALVVQGGVWATEALAFFLGRYRERERAASAVTTMSALGFAGKVAVWTVVLLLALDNLGVDVTALVAGLGVSGIAVALAVQNILGDLFASLSIVLDKPFVIGDMLAVDGLMGRVEQIGLKTTRVRSLSGEQLVFSNADLLNSRLRNYGRMFERRVNFTVGVTYQTPPETLAEIPGMIRRIVEARPKVRFDRCHFKGFGDSALDIETVYYVLEPDYALYMDTQQAINLELMRGFEERGIEFAYPTRTVFLEGSSRSVFGEGSSQPADRASGDPAGAASPPDRR